MPILTPIALDESQFPSGDLSDVIDEIFEENGINSKHGQEFPQREISTEELISKDQNNSLNKTQSILTEAQKIIRKLNKNGASVDEASKTIAHLMTRSSKDATKLRAAEIVLDLHGIRDKEGGINKQPIFQFFVKDSSVNLNSIFAPIRPTKEDLAELKAIRSDDE